MSAIVRLGTQGWSQRDWVGTFFPPGSKQEHYLPFYAQVFDTVELDTTFYHPPRASVVRSWARHTPSTFRFTAKVPQRITHEARLSNIAEHLVAFVASLEPLGERRGPLLVQLPAEFTRDKGSHGVLARFLAAAPQDARLAVEFRHASWHREEVFDLLRKHRVAFAWTEWRSLPRVTQVTADFLYLRWIGNRADLDRFNEVQIDRADSFASWQADLERVLPQVREVYGYFNNHWAGHSPSSANEMKRRLGLEPIDWKSLWPQRELF
ncbi:MAG: DUF72 domain-containing protein [Candidatus Eisenbacteria bacterium]|uniref:DUF72 domain-containing protein n=1 Tax=Eiseniibacteriota bacterium TaxID=2212470 RepID=A0A849SKR8_UNCEI|nr:DUF72 domain-containing protein [Candidatus Eisenbacteria bacterium]